MIETPQILIIEDDAELCDLYEIVLSSEIKIETHIAHDGLEAINILESNTDIDLIISDYSMPRASGLKVYEYNSANNNIPFIFVSSYPLKDLNDLRDFFETNPFNDLLTKPVLNDDLVFSVKSILKDIQALDDFDENYRKVPIKRILPYVNLIHEEIFIRLSESKFVKILKDENGVDLKETLNKLLKRGEFHIYLKRDEFENFSKRLYQSIKPEEISSKYHISLSMKFVGDFVNSFGISQTQVELIDSSVDNVVKDLLTHSEIKESLNLLLKSQGYLISHSMTALHIANKIGNQMSYMTNEVLTKLTYAAFLHDLPLTRTGLSPIFDIDSNSETIKKLNKSKKNLLLYHPEMAKKLAEGIPNLLNDVPRIIYEHHERPDGSGFPRRITASNINPLSALFILSLKIADFLYFNELNEEKKAKLISEIQNDFFSGPFENFATVAIGLIQKA